MRLRYARAARGDLAAIVDYIAADNPAAAGEMLDRLLCAARRLEAMPASGRPGRIPATRELIVAPYVIVYAVEADEVRVLRILHGARHWPIRNP